MLEMQEWAEIRMLHRGQGLSIKEIARRLGYSRNTVRSAIRAEAPPTFKKAKRVSAVDAFEPAIRELLREFPRMPTTVIAERIGWPRGITTLRDRVRELRNLYLPPDPCGRTTYMPGELAQWDLWFPPAHIPLGFEQSASPPVIVGVSGYSRFLTARMIPSKAAHDLLEGHLACLIDLGGVPKAGVYDNEAAIAARRGNKAILTDDFQRFRGTLGMKAIICAPGDPEAKGLVERANGYLETSFLPGRRFTSPTDFNEQISSWLTKANNRKVRTLGCKPVDRICEDRASMLAFPPLLPDTAWHRSVRLPRDHYVRVDTCDYSVHPLAVGQRVHIVVTTQTVVVTQRGGEVARHDRCWAKHRTVTDPNHDLARRALAQTRVGPNTYVGAFSAKTQIAVAERCLADYDRALKVVR
ncbi:MAG: IS21 family transposase [Pseudonocardiaceae bacterium]